MSYDKKINIPQIAQTNKYNVLRCVIQEGPINRAAIAKKIGLSIPTVMAAINDLVEKKALRGAGRTGNGIGKPAPLLEIIPDCFFYIGLDLGRTSIRLVVNNAAGIQTASMQEKTGDPFPEEVFVDRLCALVKRTLGDLSIKTKHILGMGVAMPGLIENGTGQVLISPDFGWKDIPLQTWLREKLPWPVLVRNSNHALALNENALLETEGTVTFCVNLGYGIGAALVSGGELYTGASGTTGELGHSVIEKGGPVCKCGNSGCLESVASGEAIARQAQTIIAHHGRSKIAELCGGDAGRIDARMVFEAAGAGDRPALKIIDTAAEYIGMGICTAVNVLDPDRVVLCGGLTQNGPWFLERIQAAMEEHIMPRTGRRLAVSSGKGGEYSTAAGASRVLLNTLWAERALPV
nr:ROK domain-containing protein [uncultured bacterium]